MNSSRGGKAGSQVDAKEFLLLFLLMKEQYVEHNCAGTAGTKNIQPMLVVFKKAAGVIAFLHLVANTTTLRNYSGPHRPGKRLRQT